MKLSWKEANYLQEFITEPLEHLTTTTKNSRGANRQNVADKHTGPAGVCISGINDFTGESSLNMPGA